jgi:CHASE3 domain sensor protein
VIARLKRATLALALMTGVTAVVAAVCFASAWTISRRDQEAWALLAGDVARIAQAEIAAERMVAIGRTYLLTNEPDLLARAEAAEAKLGRTVQELEERLSHRGYAEPLARISTSAAWYRERFEQVVSRSAPGESPAALATLLRGELLPARDRVHDALQALIAAREHRQTELRAAADDWASRTLRRLELFGPLAAIATILLAWFIIDKLGAMAAKSAPARNNWKARPRTSGRAAGAEPPWPAGRVSKSPPCL